MRSLEWNGRPGIGIALSALALGVALASGPAAAEIGSAAAAPIETASFAERTRQGRAPLDLARRLQHLVHGLWPDAQRRGVSRAVFERAFEGLEPDAEVFEHLSNQPEHAAAPWDYMARLVSETRLVNGRAKLVEQGITLSAVEGRYGVDRHVLVAVWGVESSFGTAQGVRPVIRSLATLAAAEPRRPDFWRSELLAALTILQAGDVSADRLLGSWAGASGHTQFMPTSFLAHAVDFDGDGRRDIWSTPADALASTASYLAKAGWRAGEPVAVEVVLPAGFDYGLAAADAHRSVADWTALGVMVPAGRDAPRFGGPAALVLPAGANGPAFLVSANYRAVLKYNNAMPYALAVGHLADRLAGAPLLATPWPTDDPPLGRSEREELQRRLADLGWDTGLADGVIGHDTRTAIRACQRALGLAPDGYAGMRLLERLRRHASR